MLSKETLREIAKRSGIEADELQKQISSETEETIELPKVNIFSDEDLDSLKTNVKTASYGEGKAAGEEMRMKELKEKTGLDIEGYKDPDTFISALQEKTLKDAKLDPDKKVLEMQQKYDALNATYQSEKTVLETKNAQLLSSISEKENDFLIHQTLPHELPNGLEKSDLLLIVKNRFQFEKNEEGKQVVKANGEAILDAVGNPKKASDVLNEFYVERKFITPQGRGGKDSKSGEGGEFAALKTGDEVINWCTENKIPMNEFSEYIAKAKKDNKEFKI